MGTGVGSGVGVAVAGGCASSTSVTLIRMAILSEPPLPSSALTVTENSGRSSKSSGALVTIWPVSELIRKAEAPEPDRE